jgi:hypothetical protein
VAYAHAVDAAVDAHGVVFPAACRYRRWALNAEAGIDIVVRCEIDGVINNKGEDQLLSIKVRGVESLHGQPVCICLAVFVLQAGCYCFANRLLLFCK